MEKNKKFKNFTLFFCVIWLAALSCYASILIGTFAHEINHMQHSTIGSKASITVNFDGTGQYHTDGVIFNHWHESVYFNGFVVSGALMCVSMISVFMLIIWR